MEKYYGENKTGCCPEFIPSALDGKEIDFENQKFIVGHITSIFHIPINFAPVLMELFKKATDAGMKVEEPFMLSDEKSMWGSDLYLAVDKEVPGAENVELSGTFLTKVFEGEYKDAGNWVKEMQSYVEGNGKKVKKMYFLYAACPKCAKFYGKNYVVIFAQV